MNDKKDASLSKMRHLFSICHNCRLTFANNLEKISDHGTRRRVHACSRSDQCERTEVFRVYDDSVIHAVYTIKRMIRSSQHRTDTSMQRSIFINRDISDMTVTSVPLGSI